LERARQLALLPELRAAQEERIRELERKLEEEELKKREGHLNELKRLLERERERVLEQVLPRLKRKKQKRSEKGKGASDEPGRGAR